MKLLGLNVLIHLAVLAALLALPAKADLVIEQDESKRPHFLCEQTIHYDMATGVRTESPQVCHEVRLT